MPNETKTHRILRFILFLSGSYPKTKEECITFLEIKSSAFYTYCNLLRETGFELQQEEGKYWIEYKVNENHILSDLLHFSEEESYILSCCIDALDEKPQRSTKLKQKLVSFLNQDKAIEAYIHKEKSAIVQALRPATRPAAIRSRGHRPRPDSAPGATSRGPPSRPVNSRRRASASRRSCRIRQACCCLLYTS